MSTFILTYVVCNLTTPYFKKQTEMSLIFRHVLMCLFFFSICCSLSCSPRAWLPPSPNTVPRPTNQRTQHPPTRHPLTRHPLTPHRKPTPRNPRTHRNHTASSTAWTTRPRTTWRASPNTPTPTVTSRDRTALWNPTVPPAWSSTPLTTTVSTPKWRKSTEDTRPRTAPRPTKPPRLTNQPTPRRPTPRQRTRHRQPTRHQLTPPRLTSQHTNPRTNSVNIPFVRPCPAHLWAATFTYNELSGFSKVIHHTVRRIQHLVRTNACIYYFVNIVTYIYEL